MEKADASPDVSDRTSRLATCLGCGCLCDDIRATIEDGRLVSLERACPLGLTWFRDSEFPASILCDGVRATFDRAISAAGELVSAEPGRLLIYVAGDLTCEAHREATALADRLGASIDGPASDTIAEGLLAMQRRGRATATLGELRHQADTVVFWGVDPDLRLPRFVERFVSSPSLFGRQRSRIAVDLASDRGPDDCALRVALDRAEEVDALRVMQAVVQGRPVGRLTPALADVAALARRLATESRYTAIVFDPETEGRSACDSDRAEGLTAFVQTLNGPTRAALFGLRDGGNRNGFESVLTWQTGSPLAVNFGQGFPVCQAAEKVEERLARGRYTAALVLGSPETIPQPVAARLATIPTAAIGPRVAAATFRPTIAIETGAAGLHEAGLVLRMDDVPLHVRPLVEHPHVVTDVLRRLAACLPSPRSMPAPEIV